MLKILPTVAVTVFIRYAAAVLFDKLDVSDLPYAVYEIGLLPQSGVYKTFLNLPLWYLSAMFLCLPVFIFCLAKFRDFFKNIACIIIPLLIYGFICRENIHLDFWKDYYGFINIGVLRCFAGLCLGVICYNISEIISKSSLKPFFYRVLYVFAYISLISVVLYTFFFTKTAADYFLCFLIVISLAIIFSGKISSPRLFENRAFTFLGEWSVVLYCSHWTIRFALPKLISGTYYYLLPLYILASLAFSLILLFIIRGIRNGVNFVSEKIKN